MNAAPTSAVAARLRANKQRILDRWEARARQQLDAARKNAGPVLIDSMPKVLDRLATTLGSERPEDELQSRQETLAAEHGQQRAELSAYSLEQVIIEYQLLRQVMLEVLEEDGRLDVTAHEVIAEAMLVAVRSAAGEFARRRGAAITNQLRETDTRFQHMVSVVEDYAIFTLDAEGYIASWNEGCRRMKQYTDEEAIGSHYSMLYPEEGRRRDEPMMHLRRAAIEGRFRGEGVRVRKNGDLFLADVSITPMYDENVLTGFTKVVQDLTERNLLMQERDLSRTDSERLRAEAEYRERFVATLTHDLRSPLAAARMSADLIHQFPGDTTKVQAWSSRISHALARADHMIADLLDASRLHAGESLPLDIEHCDLHEIARELCDELAGRHGDRFRIEVQGSTTGYWSPQGMRRVLDNLLSNAIKYGDPGKPITVGIHRVDDRTLLWVHNFGTIIPAEEQANLFQPYHRTRTAQASGQPGWGIGLTLVKGIVEAHGGIVKAESYPKEGTTFTVDVPVDARPRR